jgi:hypothetical protein
MALSKLASAFKVPELLAKSKSLQPVLKVLGAPKYYAGKLGRLKFGMETMTDMARAGILKVPTKFLTDQAMRYGTIEAAGALGLTNGLVGMFSEGVRNTAKRFQHEDTMSTKEWRKSLPRALAEGFFQKYFIGLINDPASWTARFLGDGIYSSGQQLYRIVSDQQDKWNSADFWRSFIEGHLLGEVQGIIFRPNRRQLAVMHANNRMLDYAQSLAKKWGGSPDDYWYDANILWQSELQNVYDKKKFYSPAERAKAVSSYNQQIQNGYTLYRGMKNAAAFDISPATMKKITDAVQDKAYDLARRQFGLTKKQTSILKNKNALADSKVLLNTLRDFNKVTEGTREEVPPENISRALQGIRAMNIDSLMDNVELYLKQYYNKDVDVLDFFVRPGEEAVRPEVAKQLKETDFSIRKEEAVNDVFEWLYRKGGHNKLIQELKGTTITDPENLIGEAIEGMWKAPSETFDRLEVTPIAYFRGILSNITRQALRKAKGTIPTKELGEEEDRLAVKEFEAEERGERYANAIYRIYDTYAKKNKTTLKRFLAFYLRSINNSRADIIKKMKTMGIDVETENAVAQLVKNARKDLERIILGREAEKQIPVRGAFTRAEIEQIRENIEKEGVKVNRITGARKDIPKNIVKAIERDGGYVVSFTSLYNEVMQKFGKDIADKVLWKANQVLQREIDDINTDLADRKAGLEIRNPIENSSTKFIISMKGIHQDEFRDYISQINKVLKQNYDDIAEDDKRFAVTVTRADDTGDVISSFDNISISHFRNFKDIYKNTDEFESIKDISRIINPVANSVLNRAFYNSDNKTLGKVISKIGSLIDLRPKTDEEWTGILDTMSKQDPSRLEEIAREVERASAVAEIFVPRIAPARAVRNEQNKEFFETADEEQRKVQQNAANINMRSVVDMMISKDIQDLFFLDIGKGFQKIKGELSTFRNSLRRFIKEKLTVLEDMERKGEPQQRAIITLNNLANTPTKADYRTDDLVKEVFADFNPNVVAGGGMPGQRAMMAFHRLGQIQREEEFKELYNPDTLRLKINPNVLLKPIKWKSGTERIQEDLENLQDRPQDLSQEVVLNILKSTDDPLTLSKVLVQNYNIQPEALLNIMGRLEEQWYRPLASWTVKAGDKNFEYFENMKNNLEAGIRQAIRLNVGRVSEKGEHTIDKISFDEAGKETIERYVKEIPDADRRERILKAVDWYYELDPDKLSYVHHEILSGHQKQFSGMIRDFINGKSPRGAKVADPFMSELLTKRKMPTLRSLIEAGYKIDNNYLNVLAGTMRYAYTKRLNEEIAQKWKSSYMDGFLKAYAAAENTKNPGHLISWAREHAGYFYLPSRSEMGFLQKRLESIQKRIEILDDPQNTDYIRLQREEADIKHRLGLMDLMRKVFVDKKYKEGLAEAILGTEMFIPGNFNSFVKDRGSKGMDSIFSGVRTQVENMKSANLTNYDGLYFNRVLWKGLRSLVFRNDGLSKEYKYDFHRQIMRFFDGFNRFLKQIRFYKPTIIMMNDLMQGALANPAYIRFLPWAFKAAQNENERNPDGSLTERAQFAQDMRRIGRLDNKSVSFDPLMTNSAKAVATLLGRPGMLGEMARRIGLEPTIWRKMAKTVQTAWRAQQEVTWGIDWIIRLAAARSMYDKFKAVYDPERAKFMAAEWANQFLVKYSRIPASTRQILNRVGFVLTYRIQTLRMYKEMMKMAGQGFRRLIGRGKEPTMYKVSDKEAKQAWFEIQPLLRALVLKGTMKALLWSLFGWGYNSVLDAITGYRAKRKKGKGIFDTEMEFLSLGTPLFAIEKHITRISRAPIIFLKYNMAAFPGLVYSLATNSNLITGERMVDAEWTKEPRKATAQLGMQMLRTYFPWAGEVYNFKANDIGLVEGIINNFGLGFYYKYQSPRALLEQFRKATDKTKTFKEHKRELAKFHFALRRAYKTLFNKEFKDLAAQLEEARKASGSTIGQ